MPPIDLGQHLVRHPVPGRVDTKGRTLYHEPNMALPPPSATPHATPHPAPPHTDDENTICSICMYQNFPFFMKNRPKMAVIWSKIEGFWPQTSS